MNEGIRLPSTQTCTMTRQILLPFRTGQQYTRRCFFDMRIKQRSQACGFCATTTRSRGTCDSMHWPPINMFANGASCRPSPPMTLQTLPRPYRHRSFSTKPTLSSPHSSLWSTVSTANTATAGSTAAGGKENGLTSTLLAEMMQRQKFYPGPPLQLGVATLGLHAHSSIVATSGSTVVHSTVAAASDDQDSNSSQDNDDTPFLTVEYRQRVAAVGQIPMTNRRRSDAGPMSREEILASRCIDRALRPLLRPSQRGDESDAVGNTVEAHNAHSSRHYHIHSSVQSLDLWGQRQAPHRQQSSASPPDPSSGHPVATALNAAAMALREQLIEPVAATVLAVFSNGCILQDPSSSEQVRQLVALQNQLEANEGQRAANANSVYCIGELLYAGTRTHAVMMEWTSIGGALPESQWTHVLAVASASVQPILTSMDELLHNTQQAQSLEHVLQSQKDTKHLNSTNFATDELRQSLGLPLLPSPAAADVPLDSHSRDDNAVAAPTTKARDQRPQFVQRMQLLRGAIQYCQVEMGQTPTLRLFGAQDETVSNDDKTNDLDSVYVHNNANELLSKSYRGQRETVVRDELCRLADQYVDQYTSDSDSPSALLISPSDRQWLHEKVMYTLFKNAMWKTSSRYGTRADRRQGASSSSQGWKTIRPLRLAVPALPDMVHGSALFARGDTQVLCTVTLGAPRDGQPLSDPYQPISTRNPNFVGSAAELAKSDDGSSFDKLPVGSLRFLRTQEALESDLNSRKSKADKERTGESGSLAEVKRAFLEYFFPAYSNGEVPKRVGGGLDRRSVGHGALAERAILPVLPDQSDFPYAMRITSEVTDSNGSSSMATVCGATLALLDAGVPIKEAVAGVSVGLAVRQDDVQKDGTIAEGKDEERYSLLLDITGTEDHYGAMDFKIAGTRSGVTAVQLDVKEPVPNEILIQALHLAKSGRIAILDVMQAQSMPVFGDNFCRPEPKQSAPRVEVIRFDPQRKRDLVGPGGAVLRQLEDRYGVALDLTQEGQCLLFGNNREMVDLAKLTIMDLVADVLEGQVYTGTVIEIKDFGAIVELLRNKEGLLHVSELSTDEDEARRHPEGNAGFVHQHLKIGQKIEVLCIGVDPIQGSVKLSRKALIDRKKKVYSGGQSGN